MCHQTRPQSVQWWLGSEPEFDYYIPAYIKSKRRLMLSPYLSVRWAVCSSGYPSFGGQHCVCSVSSTILAGSISYLNILVTNLRWCITWHFYNKSQNLNFAEHFTLWLCTSCSGFLRISSHHDLDLGISTFVIAVFQECIGRIFLNSRI